MILYVLYMHLRKPRSTLERLGTSNAERLACGWIKDDKRIIPLKTFINLLQKWVLPE